MCAGLLCAMHPRWQTQADCDAFRVFYCHSLRCQHVRLWSRCRPCLKHLRCGLACEVKQTALDEIRVRWAWLVTNQQPALACSSLWHRLPTLGQTKRELALRFASSTYFISAGSIKESLIHRGRLRFSILMMLVECCCQFTEKKKNPSPGSQVFLHQWARQDKLFLFCLCFLFCRFIREWVWSFEPAARSNPPSWLCIRMKSDHREMSYLK